MERLTLTEQDNAAIAAALADPTYVMFTDKIIDGTNLVAGDHIEVDHNWKAVVFAGDGGGSAWCCMPEWGDLCLPIDVADYVSDRAGPNGETMPIFDQQTMRSTEQQPQSRMGDEHHQAKAERKHERTLKHALLDAISKLKTHEEQKHAKQVLRAKGVLGHDD